jgi:hypothetical protein
VVEAHAKAKALSEALLVLVEARGKASMLDKENVPANTVTLEDNGDIVYLCLHTCGWPLYVGGRG